MRKKPPTNRTPEVQPQEEVQEKPVARRRKSNSGAMGFSLPPFEEVPIMCGTCGKFWDGVPVERGVRYCRTKGDGVKKDCPRCESYGPNKHFFCDRHNIFIDRIACAYRYYHDLHQECKTCKTGRAMVHVAAHLGETIPDTTLIQRLEANHGKRISLLTVQTDDEE